MRVDGVTAGLLVQGRSDGARPAEPARTDPDRTVPESRPVEVLPRRADGDGGRAVELDGAGVRSRHPRITPIARQRMHIAVAQVDGEQAAPTPVEVCRHERVRADARTGAPDLRAVERHLVTVAVRTKHRFGRFRGPNSPQLIGFGIGTSQLGQDRDAVGVCLGKPPGDHVGLSHFGQPVPSQRGLTRPRQREVQFACCQPASDQAADHLRSPAVRRRTEPESSRRWCANPPGARPSWRSDVATDNSASR